MIKEMFYVKILNLLHKIVMYILQSRNRNKFLGKQNMRNNQIPLDQEWKLPILHELLKVNDDNFVLNNFDDNEIATIIDQLIMFRLETIFIYIDFIFVFVLSFCIILPLCTK